MLPTRFTLLLLSALTSMLMGSCSKDSEDPVPSAPGGGGQSSGCQGITSVTDIDGNTYAVVTIGQQCWMAENLKTSRYRNGTPLPNVTDNTAWTELNNGAWCNYSNNPVNDATYGKLYNWYAAANPELCPQGWHVPTDAEWQLLESTLGMLDYALGEDNFRGAEQNVGGKMKATILWNAPNTGATNQSGFTGLPGGFRDYYNGVFIEPGYGGYWWSASANSMDPDRARSRILGNDIAGIGRDSNDKRDGFCVRCIRD